MRQLIGYSVLGVFSIFAQVGHCQTTDPNVCNETGRGNLGDWTYTDGSYDGDAALEDDLLYIPVGDSASSPTFTGSPSFADGDRTETVEYTCQPNSTNSEAISYSVGSYEYKPQGNAPAWPGPYSEPGSYSYDIIVTGTPSNSKLDDIVEKVGSVTVVAVKIEISGPALTQDGASANFSATVEPDDLSPTYKWSYTTPSGAGNLPTGNIFDDDTKEDTTIANAWWFASPDNKGTAAPSCDYTIEIEVGFGATKLAKTQNWSVPVTLDPNGNLGWVRRPFISGEPDYEIYTDSDGDEHYRIKSGNGNLTRNTPTNNDIVITVLSSGQWESKTRKHEEEHVIQWSSGGWKDYYSVSDMRGRLDSVSDTYAPNSLGLSALRGEVLSKIADYNALERRRGDGNSAQRESLARAAADNINPPYDFNGQN